MELHQFVLIYGGAVLMVAQIPSFHSLRHINLVSLALSLAYSAFATAGSIYIGTLITLITHKLIVLVSSRSSFDIYHHFLILREFIG